MSENTDNTRKIRRSVTLNLESLTVTIAEHYGTVTEGDYEEISSQTFDANDLPESIKDYAMLHGLNQKLVDNLAGKTNEKGHTTETRFAETTELWNQLVAGDWNAKRAASENGELKKAIQNVKAKAATLSPEEHALAVKLGLIKG